MDQMPYTISKNSGSIGNWTMCWISIHANCTSHIKLFYLANDLIKNGRYKMDWYSSRNIFIWTESRILYQPIVKRKSLFLNFFKVMVPEHYFLKKCDIIHMVYLQHTYIESVGGKKPSAMNNGRPAIGWIERRIRTGKPIIWINFSRKNLRLHFHDADGTVFTKDWKDENRKI